MVAAYSVALVGFTQAESATFESFFRMAARRPPSYTVQDEVMDAQILIVNADNTQALHLVRYAELPGKILLVGQSDGGTGWPLQRKPVKLVSVLNALDVIVGVRPAEVAQRAPAGGFAATQPFQSSQLQGLDASMRLASGRLAAPDHLPPVASSMGADRGFSATLPPEDEPARPMAPAVNLRRRRSADTEFPPTRPMERGEERTMAAMPPPPQRAAAPNNRQGTMRLTDFGGLDDLPSPPAPRSTRAPRSRISTDKGAVPEVARGDMLLKVDGVDFVNADDDASVDRINAGLFPAAAGETHRFTLQRGINRSQPIRRHFGKQPIRIALQIGAQPRLIPRLSCLIPEGPILRLLRNLPRPRLRLQRQGPRIGLFGQLHNLIARQIGV